MRAKSKQIFYYSYSGLIAKIGLVRNTEVIHIFFSEPKWKPFAPTIILWCLRWYGSTPLSYANVSDMLAERGISVHRSTIYRWFVEYAPILRKKLKPYQFIRTISSWQLDETYIKVNGKWFYLYRAIDKHGADERISECLF
ncbi:hypothetical protein XBO1_1250002 [Xenorhabdus bovienii str. oregonense]|uniref:DDE domain-containing protein n=1 Tax=Xenorhabdus bovienii str. oregonense TaxID=1398202 RepID=A0A077P0T9_XENBV|nr:hypothetical protein XBO1_1250002 [Xenorhabdus bovienii str. oregonense]